MENENKSRVQYADALLGALGLTSITTLPGAPDDSASLGQTMIHGRSHYSTRNREAVLRALESEPEPATLGELCAAMRVLAEEEGHAGASEVLPALEEASSRRPDAPLRKLAGT